MTRISAAKTSAAEVAKAARDESYWRNRGLEIRRQWRDSFDQIAELESLDGDADGIPDVFQRDDSGR